MKVLIAPDSFKGSLTSPQVGEAIKIGILRIYPDAEIKIVPIADGGEGTVECIVTAVKGDYRDMHVSGPLGERVRARYGIIRNSTAVIEMAQSSGLTLVPTNKRNPMITTSYGFGEQIKAALDQGCKKIILGIGGSATNDGGTGMAAALAVKLLDSEGREVQPCGGLLGRIADIDISRLDVRIKDTEIIVASDVTNPLCGENGASRVYAPQKGATPEMVEVLENNLAHFADIIKLKLGIDIKDMPSAGAAGGMGAGLTAFCGAKLVRGIDFLLDTVEIENKMEQADIVITGEGRIDKQSAFGKVTVGVAKRAKKYGKPVFAICGSIGEGAELVYEQGIDSITSAITHPCTLEEAIKDSTTNVEQASERLFRAIKTLYNK